MSTTRSIEPDSERSAAIDARFDQLEAKIDARFNMQAAQLVLIGILVVFGDSIRAALGI